MDVAHTDAHVKPTTCKMISSIARKGNTLCGRHSHNTIEDDHQTHNKNEEKIINLYFSSWYC
jgi:hypothetical protein